MTRYDRNTPYNDLPLLPPGSGIENDAEILRKLVQESRALAAVDSNVLRLPNPFMLVNTIGKDRYAEKRRQRSLLSQ